LFEVIVMELCQPRFSKLKLENLQGDAEVIFQLENKAELHITGYITAEIRIEENIIETCKIEGSEIPEIEIDLGGTSLKISSKHSTTKLNGRKISKIEIDLKEKKVKIRVKNGTLKLEREVLTETEIEVKIAGRGEVEFQGYDKLSVSRNSAHNVKTKVEDLQSPQLTIPNTELLMTTIQGRISTSPNYIQTLADEIKGADGKISIRRMHMNASIVSSRAAEEENKWQRSEFRSTTPKPIILPNWKKDGGASVYIGATDGREERNENLSVEVLSESD